MSTAPASQSSGRTASPAAWFVALLGWTTLLAFYDLGGGARFEPIDCWVAQTAREMLAADDWLVPRFSGETRMQKSPGPYWAVMVASLLRGTPVDETSARIPNALAAVVLVATIFWLTRRIAGDRAAVFAGFAASSSVLVLWWSHRGASDLGLTACTTVALAALWIATESEPAGPRRTALLLLGYFAAGLGMLWKMPMPLVVVGAPALLYVLICNRWSLLANRWHLLGLVLFLLPWLPWAIAVAAVEDAAVAKWKVEFLDRFTGALPNVEGQGGWKNVAFYLPVPLLYCLPFTLSLPAALVRGFRWQDGVRRDGTLFLVIWFVSLLAFFTASTGKEYRYLLPALPPLFVLLGIELSAFFDPQRPARATRDRVGAVITWVALPAVLFGGGLFALRRWYELRLKYDLENLYDWADVWQAYSLAAAILVVGFGAAAWLYQRRREHGSFALIVVTMWVMWLWAWPKVMPIAMAQRPFVAFAEQLRAHLSPADARSMRHVGTQDSRIIWYSDCRIPRAIDQLELLAQERERHRQGQQPHLRDLEYELHRYGEEMIKLLDGDAPALFVASLPDYVKFMVRAPQELSAQGRRMPPVHLWFQTAYGREDRHFVLFGNRPPPQTFQLELRLSDEVRRKLAERGLAWPPAAVELPPPPAASQPTTQP